MSMCVLVVKPDKYGTPQRAKSRIIVLGNNEDYMYSKSARYAPVLKYLTLCLLTACVCSKHRVLQQADCKNAFCQVILPDDERIAIRQAVGDLAYSNDKYWLLNKTLYGLHRSPKHWYNMFTSILLDIGICSSPHDPCLYTGHVKYPSGRAITSSTAPVEVGIYVDDVVFYSTEPAQELLFQRELSKRCKVDFMGDADFFLGIAFMYRRHDDGNLSVHLSRSAFTEHTAHRFGIGSMT